MSNSLFLKCVGTGFGIRELEPPACVQVPQRISVEGVWDIDIKYEKPYKTLRWGCVVVGAHRQWGRDTTTPVAIKILPKKLASEHSHAPMWEVEAQAICRPRGISAADPGAILPWDAAEDAFNFYFVSTLAPYGSLYDFLIYTVFRKSLSRAFVKHWFLIDAFRYLGSVAEALEDFHMLGLGHLDVDLCNVVVGGSRMVELREVSDEAKPSNSGFSRLIEQPTAHLIDLGSARKLPDQQKPLICSVDPFVKCKLLLAAPELLNALSRSSQEQCRGQDESKGEDSPRPIGPLPRLTINGVAADAWTLGSMLLELLVIPVDCIAKQLGSRRRLHHRLRLNQGEVLRVQRCIGGTLCSSRDLCLLCSVAEDIPKPLLLPYARLLQGLLHPDPRKRLSAAEVRERCDACLLYHGRYGRPSPPDCFSKVERWDVPRRKCESSVSSAHRRKSQGPASSSKDLDLLRGFFSPPKREQEL